jgi:hypothetical protein
VGTETVTSSVTTGSPSVCVLLPSTTAVGPLPSPVTGTSYNVYRYLRCSGGSGGSSGNAPASAFPGVTSTDIPTSSDTTTPLPAPLPGGVTGPTDLPSTEPPPIPSPTPPRCILGLLCG